MAKREEPKTSRGRLTVLAFQLEGSDETIQEGLRKISQSVENAFRGHQRALPGVSLPTPDAAQALGNSAAATHLEVDAETSNGSEDDTSVPGTDEKITVSRKAKPEKIPDVVTIDRNNAKVPFEKFFAEKAQTDKSKQFLVVACWLKIHAGYSEFSVDHINTLMREIGQGMPEAPRKMLQNMKGRRLLSPGTTEGCLTINSVGEAAVNRMPES